MRSFNMGKPRWCQVGYGGGTSLAASRRATCALVEIPASARLAGDGDAEWRKTAHLKRDNLTDA